MLTIKNAFQPMIDTQLDERIKTLYHLIDQGHALHSPIVVAQAKLVEESLLPSEQQRPA